MKSSDLLIVGFKSKLCDNVESKTPDFPHNKGTNDPLKRIEQQEAKKTKFFENCIHKPWMAELSVIHLFDTRLAKLFKFDEGSTAGPPVTQFARHVIEHHDKRFNEDGSFNGAPIRIVGFDTKQFVKMLGLGCAREGVPLPHELWYGAEHRDMLHAVLPTTECKDVPLSAVLSDLKVKSVEHDYVPGNKPGSDLRLAAELAYRLNLFPMFDSQLGLAMRPLRKKPKRDTVTIV